ncbi:ABC transporter ATP-binding protein [Slackia exigua]|uniref:ABC transporter ATP-binding protein n=1 Tax=Slackia exigua TaxID=84109 RepID=UPI0021086AE9|nr:ABC transporter ATP-binding protein [Slackia exigua]MCQ5091567.1 ABC transporter ATP-binding protein/permease [Slackia exigua]
MLRSLGRLLKLAGAYKSKMMLSVLCAIVSVAAGMAPYFLVQSFMVEMLSPSARLTRLIGFAAGVGVMLVVKTGLFSISTALSHKAAYRILYQVRVDLASKLTRLPLGYVLERDSGIIKKVMGNDVEELERFLAHNVPEAVSSAVVPVFVLGYLFSIDWRMALTMIAAFPVAVLFYVLMMRGSKEKMSRYYEAVNRMHAVTVEYLNGMREIRAFGPGAKPISRFNEAIEGYRRYVLDWHRACWPLMSGYYAFAQASTATILPPGLFFCAQGTLDAFELVLFLLVSLGFAAPLLKLTEFVDGISMVVAAEQNIHGILEEPELAEAAHPRKPEGSAVVFEDVSFSYGGASQALKGVSFSVPASSSTAIVGPSGSGKSTIAKLLCRFWDADRGSITIGGADVREIETSVLMDQVSFVFQDTFLFDLSIRDNIRVGKQDATDGEVRRAARLARCHEFIMSLPDGYDSVVGDGGTRLSGGERQRICIARAMLKDAPILVLDEATASIDPDSEEHIQEAIGALAQGRTLIVIAHRIRTVMGFDNILLVKDGEVVGEGTHERLLRCSNDYRKLFEAYSDTEGWRIGAS